MGTKLTTSERKEIADAIEDYIGLYVSGGNVGPLPVRDIDNNVYHSFMHCGMSAEIIDPDKTPMRTIHITENGPPIRLMILNWIKPNALKDLIYGRDEHIGNQVGIRMYPDKTIVIAFNVGLASPNHIMANYTFCNHDQKSFTQIIPTTIGLLDKYVLPSRPVLAFRRLRHWLTHNTVLAEN